MAKAGRRNACGQEKRNENTHAHTHCARAMPALPRWLLPEAGPSRSPAALLAAVLWKRAATPPETHEYEILFKRKTRLVNFSNGFNVCRLNMNELNSEPDREGLWLVRRY